MDSSVKIPRLLRNDGFIHSFVPLLKVSKKMLHNHSTHGKDFLSAQCSSTIGLEHFLNNHNFGKHPLFFCLPYDRTPLF